MRQRKLLGFFNDAQQAAIDSNAPLIAIVAGPGSGKSKTIVARVQRLLEDGVDPGSIVILTFTNAGALVLKQRLGDVKLGFIGTVHGFSLRLLQNFGQALGYRKGAVTLVDEAGSDALLKQVAEDLRTKTSLPQIKKKGRATEPIWREYFHRLKRNNMVDYDKLLACGYELLAMGFDQKLYTHLLVDEAQDSGEDDWMIYEEFPAANKFIVGDPKQSIYAFRGGCPQLLLLFAKRPEVTTIALEKNYRSCAGICEAATRLIRHSPEHATDTVVQVIEERGSIETLDTTTEAGERVFIVKQLLRVYEGEPGTNMNEIAVLCRTNWMAETFREALKAAGIPVVESVDPKLPMDWKEALLLVNIIADPSNNLHAQQWMAGKVPGSRITMMQIQADAEGLPFSQVAGIIPPCFKLKELAMLPQVMALKAISMESRELIRKRIELLPQSDPRLTDLLHDLWNHADWSPDAKESEGVFVGTMHAAKGREWDWVLLPGWEGGAFPKADVIAEDRRLAFVAVTRARRRLTITFARQRTSQFGKVTLAGPSPFIAELLVP